MKSEMAVYPQQGFIKHYNKAQLKKYMYAIFVQLILLLNSVLLLTVENKPTARKTNQAIFLRECVQLQKYKQKEQ